MLQPLNKKSVYNYSWCEKWHFRIELHQDKTLQHKWCSFSGCSPADAMWLEQIRTFVREVIKSAHSHIHLVEDRSMTQRFMHLWNAKRQHRAPAVGTQVAVQRWRLPKLMETHLTLEQHQVTWAALQFMILQGKTKAIKSLSQLFGWTLCFCSKMCLELHWTD